MTRDNFVYSLKKNGKYINFIENKKTIFNFFLWKIGYYRFFDKKIIVPKDFSFPKVGNSFNPEKPWVMWIGHCSFLIKYKNVKILTDPIWNHICSSFLLGFRRKHPPPIDIANLDKIDYVFISHNHYDHLDKKTVLFLSGKFKNIKWIVPMGLKKWFLKKRVANVIELDWWDNFEDEFVNICSVPAQHYSGRGLFDLNKSLFSGYVCLMKDDDKKLYFTGDTGYNDINFKSIGEKFKKIDLSFLPIGAYLPRKFMKPVHTDPQDAIKIHKDVNSKFSIAMHWKTFKLSDENMNLPPYELYLSLKKENIDFSEFIVVEPGCYVNW